MSLIIKNRDMPENCRMCSIIGQGYILKYHCPVLKKDFSEEYLIRNGSKKPMCEHLMKGLPHNHGGLIAVRDISDLEDKYCVPCSMEKHGITCSTCVLCDFLEELAELPRVVKYGE